MSDFIATENDADLRIIEGESGSRGVRLYTREGLTDPENGYTFLVAYIAPFGSNNRHQHTVDEVMYVASGHGRAVKGDEEGELPPGSLIHAPIGVMHQVFNDSPETMKLVCLFNPALPADELSVLLGEGANS
jgi:mannose-6-phosphate isomerase-like protein (cupin superfamily)